MYATMQLRYICTSATRLQVSKMQLGRIFNKVMQSDRTKKSSRGQRKESAMDCLPTNVNKTPAAASATATRTHKSRRVTILNKVFMKYITDLMATGEVASNLVGRGIEISHVNVAADFSVVNVYWFAQSKSHNAGDCTDSTNNSSESIEKILKVSAGHLQHELSQLRVIGLVPPINFVKNKQHALAKEVEDRLAGLDFGEDYVPTTHAQLAAAASSRAPILTTTLSPELRARISAADDSSRTPPSQSQQLGMSYEQQELAYEIAVPEMRQDVMGFDHSSVLKKVRSSMNESRAAERRLHSTHCSEPQGYRPAEDAKTPQQVAEFLSSKEQTQLFSDFLKKRAIEEKKKQRKLPLFEVKLQEERDWIERMKSDEYDEQLQDSDIEGAYHRRPGDDQCDDVLERK